MIVLDTLDVEQKHELLMAIGFYLDGHRASNEPMRSFLLDLIERLA